VDERFIKRGSSPAALASLLVGIGLGRLVIGAGISAVVFFAFPPQAFTPPAEGNRQVRPRIAASHGPFASAFSLAWR
jgi:hypothetical protein